MPVHVAQRAALPLLLAAAVLVTSCSAPAPRKRSFMAAGDGRTEVEVPAGLNPLGSLHVCDPSVELPASHLRVLVAGPEHFTSAASRMILTLRRALARHPTYGERIDMALARQPVQSAAAARTEGVNCNATIVLWELRGSRTLDLTLSRPARIPLRQRVPEQLCEFGDHQQQVNLLYEVILGLAALQGGAYDEAVYHLDAANELEDHCLQLPPPAPAALEPPEEDAGRAPSPR